MLKFQEHGSWQPPAHIIHPLCRVEYDELVRTGGVFHDERVDLRLGAFLDVEVKVADVLRYAAY